MIDSTIVAVILGRVSSPIYLVAKRGFIPLYATTGRSYATPGFAYRFVLLGWLTLLTFRRFSRRVQLWNSLTIPTHPHYAYMFAMCDVSCLL